MADEDDPAVGRPGDAPAAAGDGPGPQLEEIGVGAAVGSRFGGAGYGHGLRH